MSVKEMIQTGRLLETEKFKRRGIELIENTKEEILDAVIEMNQRLEGTWETTENAEELQKSFWALFAPNELSKVFRSSVSLRISSLQIK